MLVHGTIFRLSAAVFFAAQGSMGSLRGGASEAVPTYAADIAPILHANCVECHRPAGDGPFTLLGFDAARKRSRQIAEVVESRFMPPWKPAHGVGPTLRGERRLTDEQIHLLERWHESGATSGDLATAPLPPVFVESWKLGPPDLVLELADPFTLPAEGKDVFRNFVIPIPIDEPRFVRAVEFLPEGRLHIHHAAIALDLTDASRRRDEADPGPRWASMDLGETSNPNGHIIGWTPGQVPYEAYPGTAWELKLDTDLVVQLHMLPTGKPEQVAPRIGLFLTDEPPSRGAMVVQLREHQIDIPAGEADYRIEESIVLPVATRVLRLFPHAHYLGKDIRIFAELPDGGRQ